LKPKQRYFSPQEAPLPFNSSGVYSLPAGVAAVDGEIAEAEQITVPLADIEASFNRVVTRQGDAHMDSGKSFRLGRDAADLLEPTTKQQMDAGLAAKHPTLVSGTNIKTLNSTTLLGSGNIAIEGVPARPVLSPGPGGVSKIVSLKSLATINGLPYWTEDVSGKSFGNISSVELNDDSYSYQFLMPSQIFKNNGGYYSAIQPALFFDRIEQIIPNGENTTTITLSGIPAITAIGTATARTIAATGADLAHMARLGYVSAATVNALAGIRTGARYAFKSDGFVSLKFAISDAVIMPAARMFIGFSASAAAPTNVEPTSVINSFGLAQKASGEFVFYSNVDGNISERSIVYTQIKDEPLELFMRIERASSLAEQFYVYFGLRKLKLANNFSSNELKGLISVTDMITGTLTGNGITYALQMWRCNNIVPQAVGLDIMSQYIQKSI
jgi:hypothetical protein